MGDQTLASLFARDIVLLKQVGINPIVVHGGGPQIGQMLKRLNITSSFIDGLRVTNRETIEIVEMVLSGSINKQITSAINAAGGKAIGLSGKDGHLIMVHRLEYQHMGQSVDLGFVGQPHQINTDILQSLEDNGMIPIIAPIGIDAAGETYNINADTTAGAIASAIGATRLLFLTNVSGILDHNSCLIPSLTLSQAYEWMKDHTLIKGGMKPKLQTCITTVEQGIEAAVIIDGRLPHALLLELFTEGGAGTMIMR